MPRIHDHGEIETGLCLNDYYGDRRARGGRTGGTGRRRGETLRRNEVFPSTSEITAFGGLGVQLFFIISGFVILLSVRGRSPSHFVASRIGRLFPAYWAGVLLTGFLLLVLWPEGKNISMTQVLANLTMVQEPVGVDHIDGAYWTLWEELKFYILIGILAVVGITRSRILAFCTFWPLAAAMVGHAKNPLLGDVLMPDYASLFARE